MIFGVEPGGPPVVPVAEWPRQKAWSYSAVTSHAKCPKQFRIRRIDKVPEPPSPAMDRGLTIHNDLATYISTGELPENADVALYAPWFPFLNHLREQGAEAELQVAFNHNWIRCEWFGGDAWLRVVFDALVWDEATMRVTVVEHKTGKRYPEHARQMRLYCFAAMKLYPEARDARCVISYIDEGPARQPDLVMQRSNMEELEREFREFSQELLTDTLYPARPGFHCRWCAYAKSKGGLCEHG